MAARRGFCGRNFYPHMVKHFTQRVVLAAGVLLLLPGLDATAQSVRPGYGATIYKDALGTGVTFRAWAPNATSLYAVGEFNGWGNVNPMVKEGTSGVWSVDVPGAVAGQEYKFKFTDTFFKRDPRARKIARSNGNCIIYDPSAFVWSTNAWTTPAKDGLVVYELHVGTFYDPNPTDGIPATFYDAMQGLAHLTNLGVNCVELMPINEFSLSHSWGYNPSDIYAVENDVYGGPEGLKAFVNACHTKGIAVMLDAVHNHYGPGDLDIWEFDGASLGGAGGGIYFYQDTQKCCTVWGPRPNFERPQVRSFIKDSFKLWLDEYRIDGFRWDSPQNIIRAGTNAIPEGSNLVVEINGLIHSNYPGRISVGEDAGLRIGFDSEWHVAFHDNILAQLVATNDADRDIGSMLYWIQDGGGLARTIFTENHDKAGVLNNGVRVPTAVDFADPEGLYARSMAGLGAVLTFTSPGIPLMFMGQEMLETNAFSDTVALDWDRANDRFRTALFYRDLIRLRRNLSNATAGLKGANVQVLHQNDGAKVMAYRRWTTGATSDDVVVVVNMSATKFTSYTLDFPVGGRWYTHLNTDWRLYGTDSTHYGPTSVVASGASPQGTVQLAPYSALILSRATPQLSDADGDAMLDSWETANGLNPANASDATANPDGDLFTNIQEYERGSKPLVFELGTDIDSLTLAGSFNGWNAQLSNMKLTTNYVWTLIQPLEFQSDSRFRFVADGTWSKSWGEVNQEDYIVEMNGVAEADAFSDIFVDGLMHGLYRFTFNETNRAYSVSILPPQDSDADGMHDAWESFHGLSPTNASDGSANPDGDGYSNLQEYQRALDPKVSNPKGSAYSQMSVAGDFTGWNTAASNMQLVANGLWETTLNLTNVNGLVFKFAAGSWSNNWGEFDQPGVTLPLVGTADAFGGDIVVAGVVNGPVRFRFDENTRAYEIRVIHPSSNKTMCLAGTLNGWEPGLNNMTLVSNGVWQSVVTFSQATDVEFKFAANGTWNDNWGAVTQTVFETPLNATGLAFGANIRLTGPLNGDYTFRFTESNKAYSVDFTPRYTFPTVGISGSFNGWNAAGGPMKLVDNHTWSITTNFAIPTGVEFKFTANGAWAVNWGDTNQVTQLVPLSGSGDFDGPNVAILGPVAGQYQFTFNDETLAYSLNRLSSPDADGDGMSDAWESLNGLNFTNAGDASTDLDGDGLSNFGEYMADTQPTNAASALRLLRVTPSGTNLVVLWSGGILASQIVERASTPAGPWTPVFTSVPPTTITNQFPTPATLTNAFFRLRAMRIP